MKKGIYTYYKNRLMQVGGESKCLCFKGVSHPSSFDVGEAITAYGTEALEEFIEFLRSDRSGKFTLISKKKTSALIKTIKENGDSKNNASAAQAEAAKARAAEVRGRVNEEILTLKEINAECEDIEKEIGRNELFIAYPFVFARLEADGPVPVIKAPLLLFPIKLEFADTGDVVLRHDTDEKILLNPALLSILSYVDKQSPAGLRTDFDCMSDFGTLDNFISYLNKCGMSLSYTGVKRIFPYRTYKEPNREKGFEIRNAAVISRFSLSDPIYNDYLRLENLKDSSTAIDLLTDDVQPEDDQPSVISVAKGIFARKQKEESVTYLFRSRDYSHAEAVRVVGEGKSVAISSPPGTRCADVAVDIIVDSICKRKRVLLVSDKKMALDAIYDLLGPVRSNCIYISDEVGGRESFYSRLQAAHDKAIATQSFDTQRMLLRHRDIFRAINAEKENILSYFEFLNKKLPFGLSLSELYDGSSKISEHTEEYELYKKLTENKLIMSLSYEKLKAALIEIKGTNISNKFYEFTENNKKNPLFAHMVSGFDAKAVKSLRSLIYSIEVEGRDKFYPETHRYFDTVMKHYALPDCDAALDAAAKAEVKKRYPKRLFTSKLREDIRIDLQRTLNEMSVYMRDFAPLKKIFTIDGYRKIASMLLSDTPNCYFLIDEALSKYEKMQILDIDLYKADKIIIEILKFAYGVNKSKSEFEHVIESVMPLRILHEALKYEESERELLSNAPNLHELRGKIKRLDESARAISVKLCDSICSEAYRNLYMEMKDKATYFKNISATDDRMSIKKLMNKYSQNVFAAFPCWMLTPENVSAVLPLVKNLFDVVIFDGASQMFVEEAIPSAYRARTVAVIGDGMQIHPSAAFMRRCLGRDEQNMQNGEGFKPESLYDLARAKIENVSLRYHYGLERGEFIDFSNSAFYSSHLLVAPKLNRRQRIRPIELHSVDGNISAGVNQAEAEMTLEILESLAKKKKDPGSVGIITFTAPQRDYILKLISERMKKSEELANYLKRECSRKNGLEDFSFFVKTVENAQGEKRDNIILSPVLARNKRGSINMLNEKDDFDLLSAVNVAITRAKNKFIFISSISAEDLDDSNDDREALTYKRFLEYIRATAVGQRAEVENLLAEFASGTEEPIAPTSLLPATDQVKLKLESMGYTVKKRPEGKRISLAVYDEKKDRYLVGIILDGDAHAISDAIMEREIFYPNYLEDMGWTVLRFTAREWWEKPKRVLNFIIEAAEYNRSEIKNT